MQLILVEVYSLLDFWKVCAKVLESGTLFHIFKVIVGIGGKTTQLTAFFGGEKEFS